MCRLILISCVVRHHKIEKTGKYKSDVAVVSFDSQWLLLLFRKPELTDSASLLETFKFLENAAADFSDEEDEEDIEGREKTIIDTATVSGKNN